MPTRPAPETPRRDTSLRSCRSRDISLCLSLSLAPQKRELARGQGKPPSVRREQVEDRRSTPKGGPGQVGAVLPKDLPASVECTRGEVPLLVSPRACPFFPDGACHNTSLKRSIEARDEDARTSPPRIKGSDGRGCGDGAREASESKSTARAHGGAGRRAQRCGATRNGRECERSASIARAPSRASAHNDGTMTTREAKIIARARTPTRPCGCM